MTAEEKLELIKEVLKQWYQDTPENANQYMVEVREIIDKE